MNKSLIISSFFIKQKRGPLRAWDITKAYKSIEATVNFSKKSFERKIVSLGLLPSNVDQELDPLVEIRHIKQYWEKIVAKKRYLSLKASVYKQGDSSILFLQDNRSKRYWVPINLSSSIEDWIAALKEISITANNNLIIWPNNELHSIFKEITELYGTEQLSMDNKIVILPCGTYSNKVSNKKTNKQSIKNNDMTNNKLSHLESLESESIYLIREIVAEASNPVMLYSMGKDSAVMLHLARKAFLPSTIPFPILHVDTGWKFRDMYDYRDWVRDTYDLELIVHKNKDGANRGINPFDHGSKIHTEIMKTEALKQALDLYGFDFIFGGARRDEEKSRAKERIISFRSQNHVWDPKNQKPELWNTYNCKKNKDETARVFPLSNWTELDIWQYIYKENINIVPLYFSAIRPVINREDAYFMVDDDRFEIMKGEEIEMKEIRFRTLGCYPLTAAVESSAKNISDILLELIESNTTERSGRLIDKDEDSSMEQKKKEGYF